MYKHTHPLWTPVMCLILFGCSSAGPSNFPAAQWEDITIEVQTRPTKIEQGMIEFLIIATRPPSRPVHNLLITISLDDSGNWIQAIQDGHMGVYRRSLMITNPKNNVLNVRIQYDNREATFHFPLNQNSDEA